MTESVWDAIRTVPLNEVSLGYRTVSIYSPEECQKFRTQYALDEKWMVIGDEDETGDPILIDTSNEQLPVYSSIEGVSEPYMIAVSISNFIAALGYIKNISIGRENPMKLEKNPVSPKEKRDKYILPLLKKGLSHIGSPEMSSSNISKAFE